MPAGTDFAYQGVVPDGWLADWPTPRITRKGAHFEIRRRLLVVPEYGVIEAQDVVETVHPDGTLKREVVDRPTLDPSRRWKDAFRRPHERS
jgi:hypothetical protein